MNYTLNQLRIFQKICETSSITKAAEELHLTQPAVSIQLKNFQKQFDIPLIEVISKRVFITDFGREIASAAENIINEVNNIDYIASKHQGLLTGKLKISVVSTGKYVIPYFLSSFMRRHPAVQLHLDVTNKSKVVESLEQNEVDFSLVSILPDKLRLHTEHIFDNRLFLVGSPEKEFDDRLQKPKLLEELPLIYREEGSGTRYVMEQYIEENKLQVDRQLVLISNEAVKQAVMAGLGYSIMPLIGIRNELLSGELQIVPMKGLPRQSQWNIVWLQDKRHSPIAEAFRRFVSTEKEAIIAKYFSWYMDY